MLNIPLPHWGECTCAQLAVMARISSGQLKPVERRRQQGHENEGACASNQEVKSMTTHWLKSLWPVLLSGAQLARERKWNGSCMLDRVTRVINAYTLLCLEGWVILPWRGVQQDYVICSSSTYSLLIWKREPYSKKKCCLVILGDGVKSLFPEQIHDYISSLTKVLL